MKVASRIAILALTALASACQAQKHAAAESESSIPGVGHDQARMAEAAAKYLYAE